MVGGDAAPDKLVEPRQLAYTRDALIVLDVGTREVHALDARTGIERFLLKATGQGPGEFKRPSMLAATPSGFAVLDQANARLTAFDRSGRSQWTAVIADVFAMEGLCVRPGNRIVTTLKRRDSSVVEYDSTGRRTAVRSIPWKELLLGGVGFAYSHMTSAASPNGTCLTAPLFGSEWAVIAASGDARVMRLLEPGAQPAVAVSNRVLERTPLHEVRQQVQQSDTPQASRGVMIVGDTAIVYAAHTRTFPLQWLDYYLASTGEYLYSRKLPAIADAITIGTDGMMYVGVIGANSSAVLALKPVTLEQARASTTGSKKP